ncbi:MAG: antibiotic biosynthesis monooxygenase [Pseudomonadota bacterium]
MTASHDAFAPLPQPPYWAVIFTAQRTEYDEAGYGRMAERMGQMALEQPGCIGMEATRGPDGLGITVSYWAREEDLLAWKEDARHLVAQQLGKDAWYSHYRLRVAKVERHYTGPEGR